MFFAKNMGKHLSNKYGQKLLDSAKISTADAIKTTSKRAIQKRTEATGDLIGNKITKKKKRVSKKSSKTSDSDELHSQNKDEKGTPKERYISPEKRQQIMNKLRLVKQYNNEISKNEKFV